jgi:hypothetical protein
MYDYKQQWAEILIEDEKNQVDILASLHENGINNFLTRHFEIDSQLPIQERKYNQVFERTFQTFGDSRKFKITLTLTNAIKIKLPPFTEANSLSPNFKDKSGWESFDSPFDGPELKASNKDGENLVQIIAPGVTISMEWPRLNGNTLPPWTFVIPPFEVLGLAELELNQEGLDFFVKIIPKLIKIDIPRNDLKELIQNNIDESDSEYKTILEDCEEKFIDLFIIAANIAAYEQTPKLVTSIKIPVPVIQERPIQPACLDISNDILTVGFGIDKINLDKFNDKILSEKSQELEVLINKDIEEAGGIFNIAFKNSDGKKIITPNQLLPREIKDQDVFFVNTNSFITKEQKYIQSFENDTINQASSIAGDETFAIGINEYFFDTIVNSVLPQPKSRCEKEWQAGPVKGFICHWTSFTNPDISISSAAVLTGSVDINVGGSINACVKKFWDCSWKWACAKLALALVGRPSISLKILPADGIRLFAQISGNINLATNLPFPFNKVVEALSSVVFKFIMAFINVLASLLTFYVVKPTIEIQDLHLKLSFKNFSSFYFQRPTGSNHSITKDKFICFKTDLKVEKL